MSRILHHHASPTRQALIRASAGTAAAFLALTVAACGSAASQTSSTAVLGTTLQQACTTISVVLANGPDSDADPVGYAQAQVLPLRQLTISDATLHSAVLALAAAYEKFSTSTGPARAAAAQVVTKAQDGVNKICPQAAS